MKNTLFIDRSRSQYDKRPLIPKEKKQKSLKTNQQDRVFTSESKSNLDDFFDKFHQTFVVLQMNSKTNNIKSKIKKPLEVNLTTKKNNLQEILKKVNQQQIVKKTNKKDTREVYLPIRQIKLLKEKRTRSTLNKNNKTCQSQRNILANLQRDKIQVRKISEKKSEAHSKRKSSLKNSKKGTTKKNMCNTGSTATTTLGNSGINLKEDIHIASYLRIKIKSN